MVTCRKLCSGIAETVFPSFSYKPSLLALGERKGFDEKTKLSEKCHLSHRMFALLRGSIFQEKRVSVGNVHTTLHFYKQLFKEKLQLLLKQICKR